MARFKARLTGSAVLVAAALTLSACGGGTSGSGASDHSMGGMMSGSPSTTTTGDATTNESGAGTPAAGPHNQADVMFAAMMIPHHAQAIEMSEALLAKSGIDGKVRNLATRIKAAQGPEITQMTGWLDGWGQAQMAQTDGMGGMGSLHGGMGGMMSEQEMTEFKAASGAAATRSFLTGMIKHHQGAVKMAQAELNQGRNADARKLARNIISAQRTEISEMQQLLNA